MSATLNFCVSVDFTTNKLSKLALASFGKREGLYKSISSSIVLLEINKRKSSMLVTENATVLKIIFILKPPGTSYLFVRSCCNLC